MLNDQVLNANWGLGGDWGPWHHFSPRSSSQADVYRQDSASDRKVNTRLSPRDPPDQCIFALRQQLAPSLPFCSNFSSSPSTPLSPLPSAPIFWCPSMSHLMPGTASRYSRSIWKTVFCLRQILPFLLAPSMKPSINTLHPTTSCSQGRNTHAGKTFPESRRGFGCPPHRCVIRIKPKSRYHRRRRQRREGSQATQRPEEGLDRQGRTQQGTWTKSRGSGHPGLFWSCGLT